MCSRIKYETGTGTYITGRGMDWADPTVKTKLWVLPKGMERDGDAGENPHKWLAKYGSLVASFYDHGVADGMNEAGLVANLLFLAESDYGDPAETGKPTISLGAWAQYFLDTFETVGDAIAKMQDPPFTIIAPVLPNGRTAKMHLCLSDPTGDSAILEYLDGSLVIHHGPEYRVMTNSPSYDRQLALNAYWELIGGDRMLPGTFSAADRFVRLSYFLKSSPKYDDRDMAVASVFSQMRAIGVPFGEEGPDHATLWRAVSDHDARRYYFESTTGTSILWVDLDKVDLTPGASPRMIEINGPKALAGEVSSAFEPAQPFEWMG